MGGNLLRVCRPSSYYPTQPKSGSTVEDVLYRMSNTIIKGKDPATYTQNYAGSLSLNQPVTSITTTITGTVSLSTSTTTVTGSSTKFLSELHLGQKLLVVDAVAHASACVIVKQVTDDTHFTAYEKPAITASGKSAYQLPVAFPLNQDIGTLTVGNAQKLDKGTILLVGKGELLVNGQSLSASITAYKQPHIGIWYPDTNTYIEYPLGMNTPSAPVLAAVGGGTKNMQAGNYGVRLCAGRIATQGYNNPSLADTVTIAAGDMVQITFPAADATNGQDDWPIFVTTFADSLGADLNYIQGPWHLYGRISEADVVAAGRVIPIEWLDAEVERQNLLTFDNDPPPDSEFIQVLNAVPVWTSCEGPGYTDSTPTTVDTTSPGPFIVPAKPDNIEASPLVLAFSSSPPQTILGALSALGRIYLSTPDHLQIAQGTPQPEIPILIQPFWSVGFTGPNQVVFVNDTLYGASVQGPARSAATGDEGSQEFEFAVPVSAIVDEWFASQTMNAYDPQNNGVAYFHVANSLNGSGFWETRILLFGLRQEAWIGDILLSSTTGDQIVSSACTVGQRLIMLVGGRQANDSIAFGTYIFDERSGEVVDWYIASQMSDMGSEERSHTVKRFRSTSKTTSGSGGIFGAQPTEVIDVGALETGNASSLSGPITLPDTANVAQSQSFQVNVSNLTQSAFRVQGSYPGTGELDQVHEVVIEAALIGVRR